MKLFASALVLLQAVLVMAEEPTFLDASPIVAKHMNAVCDGVVARLADFGIHASAKACLDVDLTKLPAHVKVPSAMTCAEAVATAKILRINANAKVCVTTASHGNTHEKRGGDYAGIKHYGPPSGGSPPSYNRPPSGRRTPGYGRPPSYNRPPGGYRPPSGGSPPDYNRPPSDSRPPSDPTTPEWPSEPPTPEWPPMQPPSNENPPCETCQPSNPPGYPPTGYSGRNHYGQNGGYGSSHGRRGIEKA
ncbi:hypothetical protein K7432_011472 [Basidiobolus ranarum]|uniref:Uncharacterized protein n=1 Tax=Basidiobolus ranarum TaxID=34480 RepID=A0ABR2WMB6_9FUNG